MKKPKLFPITRIVVNTSVEGETIETKVNRIVNNKEPIKDGAPLIYTERKAGVQAAYDIRTDRFEVAIEAMDKVSKSYTARREERAKLNVGGPKSTEPKPTERAQGDAGNDTPIK